MPTSLLNSSFCLFKISLLVKICSFTHMFCNVELRCHNCLTKYNTGNLNISTYGQQVVRSCEGLMCSTHCCCLLIQCQFSLTEGVTWFTYCSMTRHVCGSGWVWYASRCSCDNNMVISVRIQIMIIDKTIVVRVCVSDWWVVACVVEACVMSYFFCYVFIESPPSQWRT